jgi:hypothetical protein
MLFKMRFWCHGVVVEEIKSVMDEMTLPNFNKLEFSFKFWMYVYYVQGHLPPPLPFSEVPSFYTVTAQSV